ncbi:amino acid permease [Ktedonobacter robiniae]|uniref:Amino acid permease n=1 Tax=Ktedonobacter robiniae TaxID=2778365 RepID=A0ABQ3V2N5_9CHLR|nr:amino acid permease [Ktedonobacter robiniae]
MGVVPTSGLRQNALGPAGLALLCIAAIAPAASMLFNVPVIASQAGAASPLVFLLSAIGVLFLGVSVIYFASKLSSAGGFYTWIRHALGKGTAFQVGWLMMGAYALFEAALQATVGGSLDSNFATLGFHLPGGWVTYALLLTLVVGVIAYFGVKFSLWVMAPFAAAEVLGLLVLDGVITFKGGSGGQDLLHTLTPAGSTLHGVAPGGALGIGLGMILGILAFIGFETGAAYGEETRHPKRVIPIATYALLAFLSVLYIWTSYAATIGIGWQHAGDILGNVADAPQQYILLANRYVGSWLGAALVILVITSNAASAFAMHQVMTRYFYAMGREGILPRVFGQTHPRWRSPYLASCVQTGFTGIVILLLGLVLQQSHPDGSITFALGFPHDTWTQTSGIVSFQWLASVVTMCILLVYLMTNVASPLFARRHHEFRVFTHAVAPLVSTLLLLLPLASYVLPPLPVIGSWVTALGFAPTPFPTNILPLFVLLWVALGLGYAWYLSRKAPERYEQLGLIIQQESAEGGNHGIAEEEEVHTHREEEA